MPSFEKPSAQETEEALIGMKIEEFTSHIEELKTIIGRAEQVMREIEDELKSKENDPSRDFKIRLLEAYKKSHDSLNDLIGSTGFFVEGLKDELKELRSKREKSV